MRPKPYHYMLAAAWRGKSSWYTLAAKHASLLKPTMAVKIQTDSSPHAPSTAQIKVVSSNATFTEQPPVTGYTLPSLQSLTRARRRVDAGGDAFFCATDHGSVAMGIADGVSESAKFGGNPAEFSWLMMEMASDRFHELQRQRYTANQPTAYGAQEPVVDAREILQGAYDKMLARSPLITGSSTACLLTLCQETGVLDSATLGDSGYALFRDSRLHHRSDVQQHRFNYPYQLSIRQTIFNNANNIAAPSTDEPNEADVAELAIKNGPILPKDAAPDSHQLQDGDLVILASDGFMDNIYENEVIQVIETEPLILTESRRWDSELEDALCRVAWRLVQTSWNFSQDPRRLSPWAQAARDFDAGYPMGG
ncbi:hypothetical protein BDF19DRAFT_434598 [Syncephalis fuscata]|nr:hypothetical protein BDF19DRAFT_434598 [Syncephalis fuscata]